MFKTAILCLVILEVLQHIQGYASRGGACKEIAPQADFDMDKTLGLWYLLYASTSASSCVTFNHTKSNNSGEYFVQVKGPYETLEVEDWKLPYETTYRLVVPDPKLPAKMVLKLPPSSSLYTVFFTDYNDIGIFTCQKFGYIRRQSAMILSRNKTLDQASLDKMQSALETAGIDPAELTEISQKECPDFEANEDSRPKRGVVEVVKKVGNKIKEGAQKVAQGAKKTYKKVVNKIKNRRPHGW